MSGGPVLLAEVLGAWSGAVVGRGWHPGVPRHPDVGTLAALAEGRSPLYGEILDAESRSGVRPARAFALGTAALAAAAVADASVPPQARARALWRAATAWALTWAAQGPDPVAEAAGRVATSVAEAVGGRRQGEPSDTDLAGAAHAFEAATGPEVALGAAMWAVPGIDPATAAAVAEVVTHLGRFPRHRPRARGRTTRALVAPRALGVLVVEVEAVEAEPMALSGRAPVSYPNPLRMGFIACDDDFRAAVDDAAQAAWAHARTRGHRTGDLRWSALVHAGGGPDPAVAGLEDASAGLPVAVAMAAALEPDGPDLDPGVGLSGRLCRRGGVWRVEEVGNLEDKLAGAMARGLSTVVLPDANRPEVERLEAGALRVDYVDDLAGALEVAAGTRAGLWAYLEAVRAQAARKPRWMDHAQVKLDDLRRPVTVVAEVGERQRPVPDDGQQDPRTRHDDPRTTETMPWEAAQERLGPALAVIADAGMGKSFLLAGEANRVAAAAMAELEAGKDLGELTVPLWAPLDTLTDAAKHVGSEPGKLVRAVAVWAMGFRHPLLDRAIDAISGEGSPKKAWLLDALDEVQSADRPDTVRGLNALASDARASSHSLVLTSRRASWETLNLEVAACELTGFEPAERDEFVRAWFGEDTGAAQAVLDMVSPSPSPSPSLDRLTSTRLLAALACLVRSADVTTITGLLAAAVERLMGADEQDKGLAYRQDAERREDKRDLLGELGWALLSAGGDVLRNEIEAIWDAHQPDAWRRLREDRWQGMNLTRELAERDGLLVSGEDGHGRITYRFVHQAFAEYFAAERLARRPEDWHDAIVGHGWFQPDWQPTLAMVAGCLEDPSPWLAALLAEVDGQGDPGHQLRLHAARGLAQARHPSDLGCAPRIGVEAALLAVGNSDLLASVLVPLAAGGVRADETFALLSRLAFDPDVHSWTRTEAALALTRQGSPEGADMLARLVLGTAGKFFRKFTVEALILPEGVLARLALDPRIEWWARIEAAEALARLGRTEGADVLARVALDPGIDCWDRIQAAEALARLGRPEGADVLARLALDPDAPSGARIEAAEALGRSGCPEYTDVLTRIALDPVTFSGVRIGAAKALARLGRSEGADVLARLALDPGPPSLAGIQAAELLARLGRPEGADVLIYLALDSDNEWWHRIEALEALARLGRSEAADVHARLALDLWTSSQDVVKAWEALARLGRPEDAEVLVRLALDAGAQSWVPLEAAKALARLGRPEDAEVFARLVLDPDTHQEVRIEAAKPLARLGRPEGADVLARLVLDDGAGPGDRWVAAEALATVTPAQRHDELLVRLARQSIGADTPPGVWDGLRALTALVGNQGSRVAQASWRTPAARLCEAVSALAVAASAAAQGDPQLAGTARQWLARAVAEHGGGEALTAPLARLVP